MAPVTESTDVSNEVDADTATNTTSDKQYQTLTPDQSMTVGKTDGSGVTLSGSQIKDHFVDTVESRSKANLQPDESLNKVVVPISDDGSVKLTDKVEHTVYASGLKMPTKGHQVAHVSFEHEIDFNHDFKMTGALGIGTVTSGGADSVGIIFAPGDPAKATEGELGGQLGLGNLPNAFGFVYDDYFNSDLKDPGNGSYFGWRTTDANGILQGVESADSWKAASALTLNPRETHPLNDFTMTYVASSQELSVTIGGQTFTRKISDITTGYSISIAASTGDSFNDYSARIDSFTYTPKTATVSVNVADDTPGDTSVSTKTPVTASIGDTISVFSTKAVAERAVAADPTLDPSLVTVIPASTTSNVYVVDGDQATASNGTVNYAAGDSSLADSAYYSYTVTGDASQAFSVPVAQAFTAEVTPVDSATNVAIPGITPIQVTTVAGKSVVVQFPGYTPVTVALNAPTDGETIAKYNVKINTSTTPSTATDVANPIEHYYTATGETIDGTPVTANVTVGTNQSVTAALNATLIGADGQPAAAGTTPAYTWSEVPNAGDTDSTDSSTPQDSKSILVPTKTTLDTWLQKATDNQAKADADQAKAQGIYDKFIAGAGITDEQKTAAKALLDSVSKMYSDLSTSNGDAKTALEAAEAATDPATIVDESQKGYNAMANMDDSLSAFEKNIDDMATTNAATQASLASFFPWTKVYGEPLGFPDVTFGDGFGATVTDAQKDGFNKSGYFYYVDATNSGAHVTPKNVGTYYFKLTDDGRTYLKSLTPDNPNAGLYVSATLTITPATATPTIQDTSVVYGAEPTITGSLGSDLANTDHPLTQNDFEIIDNATGKVVLSDQLQAGGDYTIHYTTDAQNTLKEDTNYTFGDFGTAKLTVTKRDITVTAPTVTKTYGDKDPKFKLTGVSKGELVNNDELSDLGVTLKRDTGEDVQTQPYTISADPTSNLNTNYNITVTPGSLTINKKPVTVTAKDVTATYNGSAPKTNGFNVTDGALVEGDTLTDLGVKLDPISQVNAGTYPKAVTGTATSDNYAVTVVPGTLTIAKAASSVDLGAATMVYGDEFPTFTSTNNVPGTTSAITQDDFEIVDTTGKTVTASQAQANGKYTLQLKQAAKDRLKTENPNYVITFGTNSLTVTKRPVSVTATDTGKTYGGTDPVLESTNSGTGASTGLVAGDDLGVKLTRKSGEDVGSYDITMDPTATLNQNYAINFTPGTFKIAAANSDVTMKDTSVVYGDSLPATISVTVNGSTSDLKSADFEIVDDATKKVVSANQLQADGKYSLQLNADAQATLNKANPNYTLNFVAGKLTVTKRPITVKINDVTTDYTGKAPEANGFSISSDDKLVDGDTNDSLGITLNAIDATAVGTYAISGTINPATNYAVTLEDGTLKILGHDVDSKKNVTITERDSDGNVVRIDKQWADGSETIYTDDNGTRTVTEKKDGNQVGEPQTFTSDSDKLTLTDDDNTSTTVAIDPTTNQPTFDHETTQTNGDTTTTKDAEGNVTQVVKTWPDDSKTTYTYDPGNGDWTVTEEKDGQTPVEKKFGKDDTQAKVTLGDGVDTIVNTGQPGSQPTFEHDTTVTVTDKSNNVITATTTDDKGNVIKVVKTWTNGTQTTYTYDPATEKRTVSEQKDGQPVGDAQPLTSDSGKVKLVDDQNSNTIVSLDPKTNQPTFDHEVTKTDGDTTTTTDADGNVIQVVKKWPDDTQTTYTYDPTTKTATITDQKDGKTIEQKTLNPGDTTATVSNGNGVETTVNTGKPGSQPTFDHETTTTDGDTTTTTDANKNVTKVVKKWPDDSQTTYTYDPATGDWSVTDQKDGKTIERKTLNSGDTTAKVSNGAGVETTVNTGQPAGSQPTFDHETTTTAGDTTTTIDANGNVTKVVKKWPDDSQTTYAYDPATNKRTVSDQKSGQQVGETQNLTSDSGKVTIADDNDTSTIVSYDPTTKQPTFDHQTTQTATDDFGNVTATTKDAKGNVVKLVKKWPDSTQTTYTYDPATKERFVSEQKDGQPVGDKQQLTPDNKATFADDDNTSTTVGIDPKTNEPTFDHEVTQTATDKSNNVTATTKDAEGNVVKVVKTWNDGSETDYAYNPSTGNRTLKELKDGKLVDSKTIDPDSSEAKLATGDGIETIVDTGQSGAEPTFKHETTTTETDKSSGDVTATTTDADGVIVKVAKKWRDGSETAFTYDPTTKQRMVTELRNEKTVDQKTIDPDASEVTVSDGAGGTATVKFSDSDPVPTFTHTPAVVTVPTKDTDKAVKITKKWPDGLQVVYTFDPVSGQRIIRELKDGKLVEQRTIKPGALSATLPDGNGGSTTIKFDETGAVPTFTRQLADKVNLRKVTSRKKASKKSDANKGKNLSKQSAAVKPLAQSETNLHGVNEALAGDTVVTGRVQSQQQTELPQTDEKNEGFLVALGLLLSSTLLVPFRRKRD
ncbi:MBG domain-containing protein [Levilactobacillus lindianensis]|uniref:MBG domain-containing protein n=1 Tax=Levilactobacillus lindianensis TaxID=2486018 RepID=UPI000F73B537|nr:MBG domain-containing protein [Levilactobacillus lindianensis]